MWPPACLNTLSGSFQMTPMFFLNWKNHVNYNMVAQTPQYKMDSLQDLQNIPINRTTLCLAISIDAIAGDSRRSSHDPARARDGVCEPLQHSPQ